MTEFISSPEMRPAPQCRGEVVIGHTNPRTLTKEQFKSSPDLLFHGARQAFQVQRDSEFYATHKESSMISGAGLYTTPSRSDAEQYSRLRIGDAQATPVVMEFMPYKARMFDFTAEGEIGNGIIPSETLNGYVNFLKSLSANNPDAGNLYDIWSAIMTGKIDGIRPDNITINEIQHWEFQSWKDYSSYREPRSFAYTKADGDIDTSAWENAKAEYQASGIRNLEDQGLHLIEQNGQPYVTNAEGKYLVKIRTTDRWGRIRIPPSPFLPEYLQSQGYDGLISLITGDDPKIEQSHHEYVFYPYALHKIATYDEWQTMPPDPIQSATSLQTVAHG